MKKVVVLASLVALCIMSVVLYGCAGLGGEEYTTVAPANVTTAAQLQTDENGIMIGTLPPETTEPAIIERPQQTSPEETTIPPEGTAAPGTLTGAWVGTYKSGGNKIEITAKDDSGNNLIIKFSGSGLPGITDGASLWVATDSFSTDVFKITVSRSGSDITITAADDLAGYSGTYKK